MKQIEATGNDEFGVPRWRTISISNTQTNFHILRKFTESQNTLLVYLITFYHVFVLLFEITVYYLGYMCS